MKKVLYSLILLLLMVNFVYAADIGNINKAQIDGGGAVYTNQGASNWSTDSIDTSSNDFKNITTLATTTVKTGLGVLGSVIVNALGATSSVAFYNIATGGCTGTPASGYEFTLPTTAVTQFININHTFPLGICAYTTGGAAPNITVLYK